MPHFPPPRLSGPSWILLILRVWLCFIWMCVWTLPLNFNSKNFKAIGKLKVEYKKYSVHLLPNSTNCQCLAALTISRSIDLTLNLVLMHQRNHVPSVRRPSPLAVHRAFKLLSKFCISNFNVLEEKDHKNIKRTLLKYFFQNCCLQLICWLLICSHI